MTNFISKLAVSGLFAATVLGTLSAGAQSNLDQTIPQPTSQVSTPVTPPIMDPVTPATPEAPKTKAKPKAKAKPAVATKTVKGTVVSVDDIHKTIKIQDKEAREFQITSETHIFKGTKPAILKDAATGDTVSGEYVQDKSGKLSLKTLKVNGASPTTPDSTAVPADTGK